MNHSEKATASFKEGYNCSQAVFSAFSEELNLDKDLALKFPADLEEAWPE